MIFVGCPGFFGFFLAWLMTLDAGRFVRYGSAIGLRTCRAMQFRCPVTIDAGHSFLIMHIRIAAILSSELGVYAPAVAERTGLGLVLADKFVAGNQSEIDTGNDRAFYVAVAAGCMAGPAGLFKYFLIINRGFRIGESGPDTGFHSGCRIMQCEGVGFCRLLVTGPARCRIIGRPAIHGRMGCRLVTG